MKRALRFLQSWGAALFFVLASFVCLASCTEGREWTEFRGKNGSGKAASLVAPPVAVKWKLLLQKQELEHRFFNQALLADGAVYFGSADGNFYSLNLASGYMNWTFRSGGPINSVAHLDDEKVYFGSADGFIYAVDRESGEAVWYFETGGQVNSTIIGYQDMIIAASDADAVYFIGRDGLERFSLPNELWYHNAFQVFNGRMTFAPGSEGHPYSQAVYDIDARQYLWFLDSDLDQYIWFSFPAVRGKRLFCSAVGLDDDNAMHFRFSCMDFDTGAPIWSVTDNSRLWMLESWYAESVLFWSSTSLLDYAAPVLWRDRVIYSIGDQALRSFKADTGEPLWLQDYEKPISTPPTLSGDRLYFGLYVDPDDPSLSQSSLDEKSETAPRGALVCASAATGKELWRIPVEGSILNSPVITGSWIIFGTDEGFFYVLEELF